MVIVVGNGHGGPNSNPERDFTFYIGLVWFNGISTIVGYLMPNPFSYI